MQALRLHFYLIFYLPDFMASSILFTQEITKPIAKIKAKIYIMPSLLYAAVRFIV